MGAKDEGQIPLTESEGRNISQTVRGPEALSQHGVSVLLTLNPEHSASGVWGRSSYSIMEGAVLLPLARLSSSCTGVLSSGYQLDLKYNEILGIGPLESRCHRRRWTTPPWGVDVVGEGTC